MSSSYGEGLMLRRGLIIFQLFISQGLVIITIVITQQINHFMAQPIGLNSEAVVEFLLPENKPEIIHTLKERLATIFRCGECSHEQYRIYFGELLGWRL